MVAPRSLYRTRHWVIALALSLTAATLSPPTRGAAQPAQSEQAGGAEDPATERARALFHEGLDLADSEDWERAVLRFRQALELRDAAPVRFNLASSLGHMGRRIEAIEEIDRLLADPSADRELRARATNLRADLSAELGELRVEVNHASEDLVVTVDGRPWPRVGHASPTDPGVRVVRLLRGELELDIEEVEVDVGALTRVTLDAPLDASGSDDGLLIGVLVGVGAAVLVAGAIVLSVVLVEADGGAGGDFDPPVLRVGG